MKLVIDTNVVVSGFLKDGIEAKLIDYVFQESHLKWILTSEIKLEYRSVLSRPKFKISATALDDWLDVLEKICVEVKPIKKITFLRDQKDSKFLECAQFSGADFFITGDKDFSDAQTLIKTPIVSPREFVHLHGM